MAAQNNFMFQNPNQAWNNLVEATFNKPAVMGYGGKNLPPTTGSTILMYPSKAGTSTNKPSIGLPGVDLFGDSIGTNNPDNPDGGSWFGFVAVGGLFLMLAMVLKWIFD